LGEQIDIPDHRFPKRKSLNNIYFEKQAFWMYGLKNSRPTIGFPKAFSERSGVLHLPLFLQNKEIHPYERQRGNRISGIRTSPPSHIIGIY
jgi:hypothetical protein